MDLPKVPVVVWRTLFLSNLGVCRSQDTTLMKLIGKGTKVKFANMELYRGASTGTGPEAIFNLSEDLQLDRVATLVCLRPILAGFSNLKCYNGFELFTPRQ